MNPASGRHLHAASSITLVLLIALTLAWELWIAPLRPGGSWLAVKALPLVVPLHGILSGKIYTYRWATMLVLAYFAEGAVRGYTDQGRTAALAWIELVLALAFFVSAIAYIRASQLPPRTKGTPA